jgi:uncharacterized membrane protein YkoI
MLGQDHPFVGRRFNGCSARTRALALAGAVLAAVLSAATAPAWAQPPQPGLGDSLGADWREQQNEARQQVREGRHVPLDRVIESIRRQTPGRLLDTGIEQGPDGRSVYRVRWAAANGRRMDILVDAQTGAILSGLGR